MENSRADMQTNIRQPASSFSMSTASSQQHDERRGEGALSFSASHGAPSAVEHPRVKPVVQALYDILHRVDLGTRTHEKCTRTGEHRDSVGGLLVLRYIPPGSKGTREDERPDSLYKERLIFVVVPKSGY